MSLETFINKEDKTIATHACAPKSVADLYARTAAVNEMAHDTALAGCNKRKCPFNGLVFSTVVIEKSVLANELCMKLTHNLYARIDIQITTIDKVKWKALISTKVETAQRKETQRVSQNYVEGTVCNVFITEYCAGTNGVTNSTFRFVKTINRKTICRSAIYEVPNRSINGRTWSDTFEWALFRRTVSRLGFILPFPAFATQREINIVEDERGLEPKAAKMIALLVNSFCWTLPNTSFQEGSNARRFPRKGCGSKEGEYLDSSEELCKKRRKHSRFSSLYDVVSRLKFQNFKSFSLSSRFRLRSNGSNRCRTRTRRSEENLM